MECGCLEKKNSDIKNKVDLLKGNTLDYEKRIAAATKKNIKKLLPLEILNRNQQRLNYTQKKTMQISSKKSPNHIFNLRKASAHILSLPISALFQTTTRKKRRNNNIYY